MRDTAFKRVLGTMPVGSTVKIDGPFGNLTLHNKASRAAVILTGGIGITPFRSIVLHAAKAKLPHRIILFYSDRRPEDAAFLEELQALHQESPNYLFIATVTHLEKSRKPWQGEKGQIGKAMLSRYAGDLDLPLTHNPATCDNACYQQLALLHSYWPRSARAACKWGTGDLNHPTSTFVNRLAWQRMLGRATTSKSKQEHDARDVVADKSPYRK